jgi:hypothetical protein
LLARSGCLDGSIQGQKIRLLCNSANDVQYLADVLRLLCESLYLLRGQLKRTVPPLCCD